MSTRTILIFVGKKTGWLIANLFFVCGRNAMWYHKQNSASVYSEINHIYMNRGVRDIMIKRFFSSDSSYKEMIAQYTTVDGIIAIGLYVLLMFVYYFMGVLFVNKQIYLGVPVNLLLIVLCILLVLVRKQKLASIGITIQKIKQSLLTGTILGIIFSFFMNVLPNILAGGKFITADRAFYNIFYYFVVISLSEEVVFRGYIQTRIYGLIKRDIPAMIVTGFLFYAMHLPFQMPVNGMQIDLMNMIIILALHFVMNFLYRKYNSLVAPTIFHGLLDWGGNLLR